MRFLKIFIFLLLFFCLFSFPKSSHAQGYVIDNFDNNITLNEDTTLTVKEKIDVLFFEPRHGIFRTIPEVYSARGKTIRSKAKVLSVVDELGNPHQFEASHSGGNLILKIGDPDKTITGEETYIITYDVPRVVLRYSDHDEIYWNVTGSNWDAEILEASASVTSEHAKISQVDCFAGTVGTTNQDCVVDFNENSAEFGSNVPLGYGRDFTVVVALDKNNQLLFPSTLQNIFYMITDNWGYLVAVAPLLIFLILWLKKGRDLRYVSDNPYYTPTDKKTKAKGVFSHEHLPMVYSPIDGLTPSEVGTIIDEKVDIHDVVAEIVELARLGHLKIKKIEKKKLLGKSTEYEFSKHEKNKSKLVDYQTYLMDKLFDTEDVVLLSSLKNKFYLHLEEYRTKLYASLEVDKIFDGRVDNIRKKWIVIYIGFEIVAFFLLTAFIGSTGNVGPLPVVVLFSLPAFAFAYSMPRRAPKGYSLYRQIKGLHFYLSKGKWREEVAEKHLFFEEMLPLAISLGIVNKLAKDMADLGVEPPRYFSGTSTALLAHDLSGFSNSASSTLMSAPSGSSSSWSGGSGFSGGGSSGGGFGGGGGGSW